MKYYKGIVKKGWGWEPKTQIAAEMLAEALSTVQRKLGDVPITTSKVSDPHIRRIIELASQTSNIPVHVLDAGIQKELDRLGKLKNYSYVLYDTISQIAVRKAVFKYIEHAAKHANFGTNEKPREKFDPKIFRKLIKFVQFEHKQFFPIRRPDQATGFKYLQPILVPNNPEPKYKQFNHIRTACATEHGHFVFNTQFMQKLMDYARAEDLKGSGKKYQSNGGPIPDEYAYLETLILHELLHYSYGDMEKFYQMRQYTQKEHNWAMDFRINHMLSKSGYPQIPSWLISDHINYDRLGSYHKMIQTVHREMERLPKPLRDFVEKELETDEHPPGGSNDKKPPKSPPSPYKASPGDIVRHPDGSYGRVTKIDADGSFDTSPVSKEEASRILNYPKGQMVKESINWGMFLIEGKWTSNDVTWMKPYQEPGDGPPPDGPEEPDMEGEDPPTPPRGEGPSPPPDGPEEDKPDGDGPEGDGQADKDELSSGGKPGKSTTSDKWSDEEIHRKIEDKLKSRQDVGSEKDIPPTEPGKDDKQRTKGGISTAMGDPENRGDEIDRAKPSMNWRSLIQKMVQSSNLSSEEIWSKPSRKTISGIPAAIKTGGLAVKPSIRPLDNPINKICLCLDTSGSMYEDIPLVLAECQKLLKMLGKNNNPISVVFYAGATAWFSVNLERDEFTRLNSASEILNPKSKTNPTKGWKKLLSLGGSGGTNFSSDLTFGLSELASSGFNILIFSDTDVLDGQNWTNLKNLYHSHKDQVFYIANDLDAWRLACKKLGGIKPKNWSSLRD